AVADRPVVATGVVGEDGGVCRVEGLGQAVEQTGPVGLQLLVEEGLGGGRRSPSAAAKACVARCHPWKRAASRRYRSRRRANHAAAQPCNSGRPRSASIKSRRGCAQHHASTTCPDCTCFLAG